MGRMPKAADRLPAQRESVDIRALRAAIIEHEAELKWRDDTVAELKSERNWAVKKIKALEKELEQLQAEKAAGALTELVEPRTVSAFALQAEARREEARALEEQLEAERQHERDSNRAVHIRWRGKPTLCRSDADPLPKGCRVYRTAVTPAVAERALPDLIGRNLHLLPLPIGLASRDGPAFLLSTLLKVRKSTAWSCSRPSTRWASSQGVTAARSMSWTASRGASGRSCTGITILAWWLLWGGRKRSRAL